MPKKITKKSKGIVVNNENVAKVFDDVREILTKNLDYSVSIKILGKTYTSTGATLKEAIENLKPGTAKGISLITVSKKGIKKEKILSTAQTFRLFNGGKLTREIAIKNTLSLFNI